jgi:fructose-bisphosphate aldolase class II
VRIALHGTNDFPKDIMKRCIRGGVSKVNVNKLILDDYLQHLQKNASKLSLTVLMEEGVKEVQKMMEWQVDVCGSSGKA